MRSSTIIVASFGAGFCGAALAIHILLVPAVSAAPTSDVKWDTVTANHLIVTGDIAVKSDSMQPLVITNSTNGIVKITGSLGQATAKSGFALQFGNDPNQPLSTVSALGLLVSDKTSTSQPIGSQSQITASYGLGVQITGLTGTASKSVMINPALLTYSSNDGISAGSKTAFFNSCGVNTGNCVGH